MQVPNIGRIVHYTLTYADAERINKRRLDAQRSMHDHRETSNGVAVHVGNPVTEGDVFPMMITKVWGPKEPSAWVNGQVFLDGNDTLWVTSVGVGDGFGTFAWPSRD